MSSETRIDAISELLVEYLKQQSGKHFLELPTVRELAKRYRCTQDEIISIAEEHENLDLIVGMQTGSDHSEFEPKGDYCIEWYA